MTTITIKNYIHLFWQLLKADLIIYKQRIISRFIDSIIMMSIVTIIFSFIYPAAFGMAKEFGAFVLIGILVNVAIFEIWPFTARFIADINGNNSVSYYLTLPIPSWLIFIKSALAHSCKTIIMSALLLPLGKILLWNRLHFNHVCWYKFILIFISIHLFYNIFALSMLSIPKNMDDMGTIWNRILFPLWFFGAAEFPWQTVYKLSKPLAYVSLANPFVYTMEGIRAAFFGQEGYLSFWICLGVIWLNIIFFSWLGITRLRKRLDFI